MGPQPTPPQPTPHSSPATPPIPGELMGPTPARVDPNRCASKRLQFLGIRGYPWMSIAGPDRAKHGGRAELGSRAELNHYYMLSNSDRMTSSLLCLWLRQSNMITKLSTMLALQLVMRMLGSRQKALHSTQLQQLKQSSSSTKREMFRSKISLKTAPSSSLPKRWRHSFPGATGNL